MQNFNFSTHTTKTDEQLDEDVRHLVATLCNNAGLKKQLKAMVRQGNGGIIKLKFSAKGLMFVSFECQIPAYGD